MAVGQSTAGCFDAPGVLIYNIENHPTRGGVGVGTTRPELKKEAALRLKVASGHLEGVRRMVDQETYCVDVMKQVSAVQASLEQVQKVLLRNHLLTCVSDAIQQGSGDAIIDELMQALKYDKSLIDGRLAVQLPTATDTSCSCAASKEGGE